MDPTIRDAAPGDAEAIARLLTQLGSARMLLHASDYPHEAQRGQGIGRALLEAMEGEARRRGCELLFLTTAERRADAHAFYERAGLEHTGRRYSRRLSE